MPDASVAMSVKDNLSQAVVGMKNSMTSFRTDVTELQRELDRLNSTRVQMKMDLAGATREARNAQRAFEALGDSATEAERAAAEADWRRAEENLTNIRQQYDLVGRQVRATTRDMEDATSAISRVNNRMGGGSGSGQPQGAMSMLQSIGQAGLYSQIGDMASQWATSLGGSYFGNAGGNLLSGALGGAGSGAAIGTMIAPGVGTAIGAAVGGLVGLASGASQNFETQDEYFKDYVQSAVEEQVSSLVESITSGSSTASQWELDEIAFEQLLGNGYGRQYLEDLKSFASSTPMEYSDLTNMSRALAPGFADGTEESLQRMLDLMEGIGNAGSALGVDASGMTVMAQALSRMESSGKANLEYLNMFQDRGVDVIGMLGQHYGVDQGEIYDMISKGSISGQDAVSIIQQGMERYAGAMDTMSQTFSGLQSTLADAQTAMDAAYGEGYNETRKQGITDEISFLSGQSGAMMEEANRALGAWQAELENNKEQYIRDAITNAMRSNEYRDASARDDAAEMGRIIAQARVQGMNDYNASEGAQEALQMELDLTESIRNDTVSNEAYYDAGYRKGQEYSRGIAAGVQAGWAAAAEIMSRVPGTLGGVEYAPYLSGTSNSALASAPYGAARSHAYGLNRVPYDGYRAILHEGERVLTAGEARASDTMSRNITVNVSGQWSVRDDSDIDLIAARIADSLERALAAGVGS